MRDLKYFHEIEDITEETLNDTYFAVNICGYEYEAGAALRQIDYIAFTHAVHELIDEDYTELGLADMTDEEKAHYGSSTSTIMYVHNNDNEE